MILLEQNNNTYTNANAFSMQIKCVSEAVQLK